MLKKMMLLAMAVAALVAFAAPAAQAATLSDSEGDLENGASLKATSTNTVTTINEEVSLECAHVELTGTAGGEGTNIESVAGVGTTENCVVQPFGAPANVSVPAFSLNLGAEEAEFGFEFSSPALGLEGCSMSTTGGVFPVFATWTLNTDVIHLHGGPLVGGGPGTGANPCPEGAKEIHGTYTVTTLNGDPVLLTE
ncbi:MAG TPA: hypothetical protein VFK14_09860 [Solirubrobacterales bacterium]|nr:hypothetical protein [Solirubrobacterales bacterium]